MLSVCALCVEYVYVYVYICTGTHMEHEHMCVVYMAHGMYVVHIHV